MSLWQWDWCISERVFDGLGLPTAWHGCYGCVRKWETSRFTGGDLTCDFWRQSRTTRSFWRLDGVTVDLWRKSRGDLTGTDGLVHGELGYPR